MRCLTTRGVRLTQLAPFYRKEHRNMNLGHKLGRLRNRLARLKKKTPDAGADRQGAMTARIAEIEDILRKAKA